MTGRTSPRFADGVAVVLLAATGLLLTFKTGFRGFFPFDQSIVFDGGYRVLAGQVPYKDFVMPFGPAAFWLQAIFFRLLGVSYFAYVFGAAAVNALAVIASVTIVRLLLPGERVLSYLAGLVTAVWFYPPFGTPWVDQTAFFFSYGGIVALLAALKKDDRRRRGALLAVAGALSLFSLLSKQNAGSFMLPIYPLLVALSSWPDRKKALRDFGAFAGGLTVTLLGFVTWLLVASDVSVFNRYVIAMPSELGKTRLIEFVRIGFGLLRPYFGPRAPLALNLAVVAAVVAAVYAISLARRKPNWPAGKVRGIYLAGAVAIYLAGFQHLFMNTTLNQQSNAYAFLGPIVAIGAAVVLRARPALHSGSGRIFKAAVLIALCVGLVFVVKDGVEVGMSRTVQDIYSDGRFDARLDIKGLEGLKWQDPLVMRGFDIYANDLSRLIAYLRERRLNFFEFPDFTILYGLVGVPSPQPLLWFHEGVTYPPGGDRSLDSWIVRDLEKNDVGIVVIEQVAWLKTGERLDAFPELKSYIYGNFVRRGQFGIFAVYERGGPGL